MLASTPHNRHGSARFDARKAMPTRQPLEMHCRYRFHSTRPAPWKRVGVASSVDRQSKGGVNFRHTTRRCFSVWLSRSGKVCEVPWLRIASEGADAGTRWRKRSPDLLIVFDLLASIEPGGPDIFQVFLSRALEVRAPRATSTVCFTICLFISRPLLRGAVAAAAGDDTTGKPDHCALIRCRARRPCPWRRGSFALFLISLRLGRHDKYIGQDRSKPRVKLSRHAHPKGSAQQGGA